MTCVLLGVSLGAKCIQGFSNRLNDSLAIRSFLRDESMDVVDKNDGALLSGSLLEDLPDGGQFIRRLDPVNLSPIRVSNPLQDEGLAGAVAAMDDEAAGWAWPRDGKVPRQAPEEVIDLLHRFCEPRDVFQNQIALLFYRRTVCTRVLLSRLKNANCTRGEVKVSEVVLFGINGHDLVGASKLALRYTIKDHAGEDLLRPFCRKS